MFQIDDGAGFAIAQAHQPLIVDEGLPLRNHHICGTLVEGSYLKLLQKTTYFEDGNTEGMD